MNPNGKTWGEASQTRKIFLTPEGDSVEDEAIEVEPVAITHQEPIVWEYADREVTLRRVVLYPRGVKLWKALNETDSNGSPLMSFEPRFDAEPWSGPHGDEPDDE